MKTIDLNKIIEDNNLDVKELAGELFPDIKYPKLALDRILRGESKLDTDQLSRLSLYTGLPIEVLYSGTPWKTNISDKLVQFKTGDYKAELDRETWVTKIFHKGTIFHESIIHQSTIPLDEYFEELNSLINKHQNKE